MGRVGLVLIAGVLSLSACGEASLRDLRNDGNGPDEFIVLPTLPLQQPESYTALPEPTPGARNATDPTPLNDGTAALGGRRGSANAPVPGADAGLVSYAGRNGVNPGIRAVLAEEDAAFRKRRGRFANIKLFPVDRYNEAYARLALDPHRVARRFERAGIPTPTAPPKSGR